jgi:hypothetical protein
MLIGKMNRLRIPGRQAHNNAAIRAGCPLGAREDGGVCLLRVAGETADGKRQSA